MNKKLCVWLDKPQTPTLYSLHFLYGRCFGSPHQIALPFICLLLLCFSVNTVNPKLNEYMSIHPRIKTKNNLTFTFGKHWNNEILVQELNKYQNKHLAMYYILLYSNFTGVVGLPGQGVLSGNLLHLTDVHLTLGHCMTQFILRKCERDSGNIHLLHSTQKILQDANHNVSHFFFLPNLNTGVSLI